jgi:hypothetical protein
MTVVILTKEVFMMSMIHFSRRMRNIYLAALAVILACALCSEPAFAVPVPEGDAVAAVNNWLRDEAGNFRENNGQSVKEVRLYKDGQSGNIGLVILPADDEFWPIQSFGRGVFS